MVTPKSKSEQNSVSIVDKMLKSVHLLVFFVVWVTALVHPSDLKIDQQTKPPLRFSSNGTFKIAQCKICSKTFL